MRWAFRIVTAVAAPLVLLAAVEGGLRLAGVGHPSAFTLPCTVNGAPAFCDNDRFTWPFFPPGAFRRALPLAIPAEKGPRTFRIFVVGESAAMGDPEPAYGFGRYLEVMLRERFPAVRFEVHNAGVTAVSSHVLVPIAEDLARRQGDLFVVYAGNNEVVGQGGGPSLAIARAGVRVRSTRVGQQLAAALQGSAPRDWRGMEGLLDRRVSADSPRLAEVREQFRANLRDLVEVARASGARVVLSTVAVNERDCAPFASVHRAGLAGDALRAWDARYAAGLAAERAGDFDAALGAYEVARAIDDRHADLWFRIGRCRRVRGERDAAREAFARALELDALRFRADASANAIVREVAREAGAGVALVDGAAAVAAGSADGIAGQESFHEHVHLNAHGNDLLARAVFAEVAAALPAWARAAGPVEPPARGEVERALAFTGFDRRRVAAEVLDRLGKPPFTGQSNHDEQLWAARRAAEAGAEDPAETAARYRAAIVRSPDDATLRAGHGFFLLASDPAAAAEQFRIALRLRPTDSAAKDQLVEALLRLGRLDEAIALAREVVRATPYHYPAYLKLAWALAETGRLEESVRAWEQAIRARPSIADHAWAEIGRLEMMRQRWAPAAEALEKALQANAGARGAGDLSLHLSHALGKLGRAEASRAALERAILFYGAEVEARPRSAELHVRLADALAAAGDRPRAVRHYGIALELAPGDAAVERRRAEAAAGTRRGGHE